MTGKEEARIGMPSDRSRGDRVPSQGPSSPECAPCAEDHRPAGVAVEGPEEPHTVVPCRGGQDRDIHGRAPWQTPPAQLTRHCTVRPRGPRLLGPGMDHCPSSACLVRAPEQTAALISYSPQPVYQRLEPSYVLLCLSEGHTHWMCFCTCVRLSV